jgi:hypothetical protein
LLLTEKKGIKTLRLVVLSVLVQATTLDIWSPNSHYLDGELMRISDRFVKGPGRHEQIDGASHWITADAFDPMD